MSFPSERPMLTEPERVSIYLRKTELSLPMFSTYRTQSPPTFSTGIRRRSQSGISQTLLPSDEMKLIGALQQTCHLPPFASMYIRLRISCLLQFSNLYFPSETKGRVMLVMLPVSDSRVICILVSSSFTERVGALLRWSGRPS